MKIAWLLPFVVALAAAITYYFSNRFDVKHRYWYHDLMSFSSGVSITYVLLELFPTFTEQVFNIHKMLFLSVAVGFISHHLIEKYIYQHNRNHQLIRKLTFEENVFSFIYHIILGIVLVTFAREDVLRGVLFSVPLITYTFVSTLPTDPHKDQKKSILMAASTLFGVLFATFFWTSPQPWLEFTLVGLALGVLLFTVIRHHIPFGRRGKIEYFTAGFLIYTAFIVSTWYL